MSIDCVICSQVPSTNCHGAVVRLYDIDAHSCTNDYAVCVCCKFEERSSGAIMHKCMNAVCQINHFKELHLITAAVRAVEHAVYISRCVMCED